MDELRLENVINVAECEVEISYDANLLGLMKANTPPGITVVSARRGRLTLRGSWTTPQSSDFSLATLLYTPIRSGETSVSITRGILKNSPTDTPGTVADGGFFMRIVDRQITNVRVTPGDGQLAVTWNRVPGANAYIVRGFGPPDLWREEERVQAPTTTVTLTNLRNDSKYTVWVAAEKNNRLFATARRGVTATPSAPVTPTLSQVTQAIEDLSSLPNLRSRDGVATTIIFRNNTNARIAYYWVNHEGNEQFYGRLAPGASANQGTFAGHVWLIKNASGRNLAVFRAVQTPVTVTAKGIQASVTFTVHATRPPIYWTDTADSTLHRLIGTEMTNLAPGFRNATSLAVDVARSKLYWTERTSDRTGKIRRANLDGTNVQLVKNLTSAPYSLALDTTNRKIYLTNAWGKVQRMNFNGSNFQANLVTGLKSPKNIAVGVAGGKIYWTEQSSNTTGRIQRANLDGSNRQLVKNLTSLPRGLALDTTNGKIYLTNAWGKVQRMNFDGSGFQPNFITGLQSPGAIAVDVGSGTLYWTESSRSPGVPISMVEISKMWLHS